MEKLKQLQTKNNVGMVQFNMDSQSKHNLERAHKLTEELLSMKVSNGVILRRALFLYRLHFMENAYEALKDGDQATMIEKAAAFVVSEKELLADAAEGEFYEDK